MKTADLSVVGSSVNSIEDLAGCLDALRRQEDVGLEVIVVDCLGGAVAETVHRAYSEVVLVPADPETPIPQMRPRILLMCTLPQSP